MALIEVKNISKTFPNGTEALNDVSFEVHKGDFIVIGGSNGSGKSVLMSIIAGLEDASKGEIVNNAKEHGIREHVGLVFQDADAQILGETPEEDVAFGPKTMRLPKDEIAKRVNDAIEHCGLTHRKHNPARLLSGGEKRRLAVAGVIAMECEIIIMDEPFANLDWNGVQHVCAILKQLKEEGKTLVVLTHELEKILALASRFIVLDRGLIRFDGTVSDGLKQNLTEWSIRNPLTAYKSINDLLWD